MGLLALHAPQDVCRAWQQHCKFEVDDRTLLASLTRGCHVALQNEGVPLELAELLGSLRNMSPDREVVNHHPWGDNGSNMPPNLENEKYSLQIHPASRTPPRR